MDPLTRRRAEIDRRRLRGLTVLLLSLALMGFVLFDSKVPSASAASVRRDDG
jgi:hypothetical protein